MKNNIEELERRYRALSKDFQSGRIDEATFTSRVDQLQFQDEWGRYWMIGAQSGAWHYYDGQAWHQADPREADKLPFMDDQGRYWQRGTKSGDWYYYQPETGEWVKPSPGDTPPSPAAYGRGVQASDRSEPSYYQSHLYQQSPDLGPGMPSQLEGELYQDDEGRYWAVGGKSGQWYFFDHDGWHPAHEFQSGVPQQRSSAPYQPAYSTQPYPYPSPQVPYQPPQDPQSAQFYQSQSPRPSQVYGVPPQPPLYAQPAPGSQPTQVYSAGLQSSTEQPVQPQSLQQDETGPAAAGAPVEAKDKPASSEEQSDKVMPAPPGGKSETGSWFYFDGKQWLKYSSDEPLETPPPGPQKSAEKESDRNKVQVESKGESVIAEFFEDEPPEVVDVEVVTVYEAEPDHVKPEPVEKPEPVSSTSSEEEVKPRQSRVPADVSPPRATPAEPPPQPLEKSSVDPSRPVMPRKKETAHEPTIIIPTGVAASSITSPATSPVSSSRAASRPMKTFQPEQRRPRENTAPMEPALPRSAVPVARSHGEITQAMPVPSGRVARAATAPVPSAQTARQVTQQNALRPAAAPAAQPAASQPKKDRATLGDVLRSFPSTFWTVIGGLIFLLIFAFVIVGAMAMLNRNNAGVSGVAVVQSPTPTLDAGPPDATPTPGPTPALSPEATEVAPTPPTALTFSSPEMGITLEYPETWYRQEEDNLIVFSPSETGLDPKNLKDSVFWVAGSDDPTISKLLTEALTNFPADAENLNEGTISIASQTWTSVQIRFKDKNLGQGIATVAVTGKEGKGYVIVAIAPAEQWNAMQPLYQGIINSFRFSSGAIAQATETQNATPAQTETKSSSTSAPTSSATKSKETTATAVPSTPTPTPAKATATPLVYVIQSGDTLLAVANQFGVDVDELAAKNGIDDPGKLSIGQELIIPFTAEELAAYNAGNGGRVTSKETTDKAATAATTTTAATESTAAETDTEKPAAAAPTQAPQSEAAPISGRVIYPAFNPGTNVYDLWMVDVATGEQTGVASEASQPDFSRDGSLLAYRSWGLGTRGIFFRDFVGGRGGQVTRFVEDGLPTWAPDGYTFAFASRREGDRVPRIYVGNQMGKEDYSIGFQGEYPATFPDGRLIVKGCLPSGDCGVFIMGPTGGGETKISSEVSDTAPAVSPDGNKIAFMSYGRGGGTNWELWVMNADGTNPQRLTDNHSNEGLPTWSPDGRSIAYVSDQDGAWSIWVMNADGSNQRRVALMKGSPDGKVLRDVDNSKGWLEERISWAP